MSSTGAAAAAVIFDLDGTLVQSRAASWEIFRKVSDQFGLGVTDPEQYYELFNGNVFASIRALCPDEQRSEQVSAAFLQRLRDEYEPALVPGMVDVIRRLATVCTLAVISSNSMQVLRRVLVAHDIAYCFAHVFGGDVTPDKRTAIRQLLSDAGTGYGRRCTVHYDETSQPSPPDGANTVLVTDTAGDVRDARAEGIRVIGVAWGMHDADELMAAGAEFVAIWPQEIASYLLADVAAASCPRPVSGNGDSQGDGGGCGCASCEAVTRSLAAAGSARRRRRREAAAALAGRRNPPARRAAGTGPAESVPASPVATVGDEMLDAVRHICRPGRLR